MYGETVIIPAIPDFIKEFGITYSTSSWILGAYLIAGAVMTPISGKLSDIYGKKKMVLIIMCIYTVGVAVGSFATNIWFMIIARILQGVGISMFPIAFGMIKLQFPIEKFSIAQGIFTGVFTAGSAIGLALGGTIIYHYGWHFALLSMVPATIILILLMRKFIHITEEEKGKKKEQQQLQKHPPILKSQLTTEYCCVFTKIGKEERLQVSANENESNILKPKASFSNKKLLSQIDIKGATTLSVTIISFLLALSYLENIHTSSISDFMPTIILSIISIVSLILFIIVEKKISAKGKAADFPLIDLSLLANKIIILNNIILMIMGITMLMVYQSISVLIRSPSPLGFNGNAISAANVQIPFTLIILIVSVSAGIIISKFGNIRPSLIGTMVSSIGFFSLFLFHSSELLISTNLAVIGIGLTLTRVGSWNILLEHAPKDFLGVSLGMTAMLFFVGMAIGPTIASVYMQSNQASVKGSTELFPSLKSYDMIFITGFFISLISIILMVALKKIMSNPKWVDARSIS